MDSILNKIIVVSSKVIHQYHYWLMRYVSLFVNQSDIKIGGKITVFWDSQPEDAEEIQKCHRCWAGEHCLHFMDQEFEKQWK